MVPPASERDRKLTVLLTLKEMTMLEQLAEDEARSVSDMIRALIRSEHIKRYGTDAKPQATTPTMRGILKDITGRATYTAAEIAERAGLSVSVVLRALEALKRARVLTCTDGEGAMSIWEGLAPNYDEVIDLAMKKGIDIDVRLK